MQNRSITLSWRSLQDRLLLYRLYCNSKGIRLCHNSSWPQPLGLWQKASLLWGWQNLFVLQGCVCRFCFCFAFSDLNQNRKGLSCRVFYFKFLPFYPRWKWIYFSNVGFLMIKVSFLHQRELKHYTSLVAWSYVNLFSVSLSTFPPVCYLLSHLKCLKIASHLSMETKLFVWLILPSHAYTKPIQQTLLHCGCTKYGTVIRE